jgi:hypothetical protein
MFSNAQKAAEAERELEMRKRVYGRKGRLTPIDEKRIAMMAEIGEDYRKLSEVDKREELLI